MQNPYSEGDYVDCKHPNQGWCVARVLEINQDIVKVRFDGMSTKSDASIKFNNPKLAPFRRHTVGYTGLGKSLRDDNELKIDNANNISTLIDVFSQKDYLQFEAAKINQNLRGKIFLFTDALLSEIYEDEFPMEDPIEDGLQYLEKFLDFAIHYLRNFPKHFIHFLEGYNNMQMIVTKPEVAYSFFITELLYSLAGIFGGMQRCSRLYRQICEAYEPHEIVFKPQEPVVTKGTTLSNELEEKSSSPARQTSPQSDEREGQLKMKIDFANSMTEKFAAAGGFKALLNLIYNENEEENGLMSDRSTTTSANSFISTDEGQASGMLKYGCPLKVVEDILRLFRMIHHKLKDQFKASLLAELKQRLYKRIKSISDVEIRELEIEQILNLFKVIEGFLLLIGGKDMVEDFYEFKEMQSLNLFLRFMDSPSFEKKLKGINGIRDYAQKIESASEESDDPTGKKDLIKYLDADKFSEWVLENKIIELIHEKYLHVELIKRSFIIQRFVAENAEQIPPHLIDLIWNSVKDKNEEIKKAIYENFIELAPSFGLDIAEQIFDKFLQVEIENYDEDFVNLIGKYTENALRLFILKTRDDEIQINEVVANQENPRFFGVGLMFNLVMDDSPLNTFLSHRVLEHLQNIISEYPATKIFLPIVEQCLKNLENDVSIYQSLVIMKEYFSKMQSVPNYQQICEEYFQKFKESHNIIDYLTRNIQYYWQKVSLRVQAIKSSRKDSVSKNGLSDALQKECFIGKFSHELNIYQRVDALRYFIVHTYLKTSLSIDQLKQLWNVFVKEPNFQFETSVFLQFMSQFYNMPPQGLKFIVEMSDIKEVLLQILLNKEFLSIQELTQEKLNCIEFYFIFANIYEKKLRFDQTENLKSLLILKTSNIFKQDHDLVGFSFFWECLIQSSDKEIAERVTSILVDLSVRVDPRLNMSQETICSQVVQDIMPALKRALEEKNFTAIEKYILFLNKFFHQFEDKSGQFFQRLHNYNLGNSTQKMTLNIKLLPYNITRQVELSLKERIGYIREMVADHFDIGPHDFELTICGTQISGEDVLKDLATVYTVQNPNIEVVKKPASELHLDFKSFAVKEREYVQIFFDIFATMINNSELRELKSVWDFVHKLPLQVDIKNEFKDLDSYIDPLNGENQLCDQNIFKIYYYLSIIQSLALSDEYIWKLYKTFNIYSYKGEWSFQFENNEGIHWLVGLILNTDFQHINHFLYIKVLLILTKLLWFYIDFEEGHYLTPQFFTKCLDIFKYSAMFISSIPKSSLYLQTDVIKDHGLMCYFLSEVIQKILKSNDNYHDTFLRYSELENLLIEIFMKLPHEEAINCECQENFINILSLCFKTLQKSSQKQIASHLFTLLFDDIFFRALNSHAPNFIILRFLGDVLSQYDMKNDFDCDIDVLNIMIQVSNSIKNHQRIKGHLSDTKLVVCFGILRKFLEKNTHQIEFFGQEQGLVYEILSQGILKAPTINGQDGPKYQGKSSLVQPAFELLLLLGKDQTNFKTITNFLLPIHKKGIWRNSKYSSWFLCANIKKRTHKYAGLKNLGCTCYMNSTLQQLFMIPTFRKHLPMLEDPKFNPQEVNENLLFQLKRLFYGMNHIDKEYFSPKQFCLSFRDIDGTPTSFIEQKDAFEFLSLFMDRIEEQLKGTRYANIIKSHFSGLLSNELICKGCPHYYEREEPFIALNLTVKNKRSIKDGLERLVEGEILDADNAYYCEQCKMKVKTVKRASIKKLPPYLFLTLSRFEYNFDLNVHVKVNDYCEFPFELDMTPYTQQHLNQAEKQPKNDALGSEYYSNSKPKSDNTNKYTLKGVVIHMGTADSGHYYSIIRDKKTDENGAEVDTWIDFNDNKVSEFNIANLGNIAFGDREGCPTIQSAYVLVYEKKEEQNEDLQKLEEEIHNNKDAIEIENQGEQLQNKDEESFMQQVVQEVQQKNLRIFYISNIFSHQYPVFLWKLIKNYENTCCQAIEETGSPSKQPQDQSMEEEDDPRAASSCLRELFSFVLTVYCTMIVRMNEQGTSTQSTPIQKIFFEWLYSRIEKDTQNCRLLLDYFVNHNFLTEMLLQNPLSRNRRLMISLITKAFRKIYKTEKDERLLFEVDENGYPISLCANFLCSAINLLDTTKLYLQTLSEYFYMFITLIKIDSDILQYLLSKDFLGRLLSYFFMHGDDNQEFKYPTLNSFDSASQIEYNTEITTPSRKYKSEDFTTSDVTNLGYLFQLIWKLLKHTSAPTGSPDGQYKKPHPHPEINYNLNSKEAHLLNLTQEQIAEMFDAIDVHNKRSLKAVCKIISFAAFNSGLNSNSCIKYLAEEIDGDTTNDRVKEIFGLIQQLARLKDKFSLKRNKQFIRYLTQKMTKREDDFSTLNLYSGMLLRLINKNQAINALMQENEDIYDEIMKPLLNYVHKTNLLLIGNGSKPVSFQIVQKRKEALKEHIKDFEGLRDGLADNASMSDASSQPSIPNYKRQQNIQYYDTIKKKWLKGTVEAIYEDVVKVKKTITDDSESPKYEWFDNDDTSYLQPADPDSEIEEEDAQAFDFSNREYTQEENTTDEYSARPNSAFSSPGLDE